MTKNLVVDLTNIVFSIRHGKFPKTKSRRDTMVKETIFISALETIAAAGRDFGCNSLVICEDSPNNWRKEINPTYKANRALDPYEDPFFNDTLEAAGMVSDFVRNHTAGIVLKVKKSEADDIIAVWTQDSVGVENVILSSDTDFIQLISQTTKLYSQTQRVLRESDDPQFDLFLKCVRGDKTDNLPSAYPRVRESVLRGIWDDPDPFAILNFMNTSLKDGSKISDQFNMNMQMIDLSLQPDYIRLSILDSITEALNTETGNFNEIQVARFLAECGLKQKAWAFQGKTGVFMKKPVFQV